MASQDLSFCSPAITRVVLAMALGMDEPKILALIRPAASPVREVMLVQPLRPGLEPCNPLSRAVWLVFHAGDERLTAQRTDAFLAGRQGEAAPVHRRRGAPLASLTPVVTERRIVKRRPAPHQLVSSDAGPGELGQMGTSGAVSKDPVVVLGPVEPAEVLVDAGFPPSGGHLMSCSSGAVGVR